MLETRKEGEGRRLRRSADGWLGACSMTGVRMSGQPGWGVGHLFAALRRHGVLRRRLWWARSISGATTPSAVGRHDQHDPRRTGKVPGRLRRWGRAATAGRSVSSIEGGVTRLCARLLPADELSAQVKDSIPDRVVPHGAAGGRRNASCLAPPNGPAVGSRHGSSTRHTWRRKSCGANRRGYAAPSLSPAPSAARGTKTSPGAAGLLPCAVPPQK